MAISLFGAEDVGIDPADYQLDPDAIPDVDVDTTGSAGGSGLWWETMSPGELSLLTPEDLTGDQVGGLVDQFRGAWSDVATRLQNDPILKDKLDNIEITSEPSADGSDQDLKVWYRADGSSSATEITANSPGIGGQIWGAVKGAFGAVNTLLASPAGRLIAGLGIGAGAVGLSSLLTGNTTFRRPAAAPPNPLIQAGRDSLTAALGAPGGPTGTQTGQQDLTVAQRNALGTTRTISDYYRTGADIAAGTLIGQAPQAGEIRNQAISEIPDLLMPTGAAVNTVNLNNLTTGRLADYLGEAPQSLVDPINAGLNREIMNVLEGRYSNPQLERGIGDQETALRARLYRQWGPGYESTSAGIRALADFNQRAIELRETDKRTTLAANLPQEQTRRAYNMEFPQNNQRQWINTLSPQSMQQANYIEQLRNQGLQERVNLSQNFGIVPPEQVRAGAASIVNPAALTGLDAAAGEQARNDQANMDAAKLNYAADRENNNSTARSIGNLAGIAAGGLFGQGINAPKQPAVP